MYLREQMRTSLKFQRTFKTVSSGIQNEQKARYSGKIKLKVLTFKHESLILAQDERWRRA